MRLFAETPEQLGDLLRSFPPPRTRTRRTLAVLAHVRPEP
jgi:hypothetical protein